jgi:hypothetical protein
MILAEFKTIVGDVRVIRLTVDGDAVYLTKADAKKLQAILKTMIPLGNWAGKE